VPAVGQLVDHGVQPVPVPAPSVSQPLALYVPEGHADVPVSQPPPPPPLPHVLVTALHVPVVHTQPKKSAEDEELAGHVSAHADTVPLLVLIAVAWNAPDAHAVQTTSDVSVPAVA
jgi:hypothetical protein